MFGLDRDRGQDQGRRFVLMLDSIVKSFYASPESNIFSTFHPTRPRKHENW